MTSAPEQRMDFIREIIAEDLRRGTWGGRVHTRFPPEPNGYLHIGHAKSICLNFGIATEFGGKCNLRLDDTNPMKEEEEYVASIKEDVRWLGFDWEDREYYASDYFDQLYGYALALIRKGKAYVDSLTAEEIRQHRGTLTEPGRNSPYRDRTVEENLDLFRRMGEGEFEEGTHTLRAKIDMASGNLNLRDPVLYRIMKSFHHRTGDRWKVYPMYDFAHGQSDSIEGITHSLCTLEFEDHRPLYDWFLEELGIHHPRQIEFARLNLTYTALSKRRLLRLVNEGHVSGWDDPRMPTLSGMRRRGYTPESIRRFCDVIGLAKKNSTAEIELLEHCLREDLNRTTRRTMAVLDPLRVVIENYPEGKVEWFEADNHPDDPSLGTRKIPFSREIFIERDDFMEAPPKKFFRLSPGREVRLKHTYYITCTSVERDTDGRISTLRCMYDPESRGGSTPDGRKIKGTLHWVSALHAAQAQVRLYDYLFKDKEPDFGDNQESFARALNSNSLKVLTGCMVEQALREAGPGSRFQFLRHGYFCVDRRDSSQEGLVFNRTITLRDSWARVQAQEPPPGGDTQRGKVSSKT